MDPDPVVTVHLTIEQARGTLRALTIAWTQAEAPGRQAEYDALQAHFAEAFRAAVKGHDLQHRIAAQDAALRAALNKKG